MKKKQSKPISYSKKHCFNNYVFFIPTKASPNQVKQDYIMKNQAHLLHQQHKEYVQLKNLALAGAVWYDKLKKYGII